MSLPAFLAGLKRAVDSRDGGALAGALAFHMIDPSAIAPVVDEIRELVRCRVVDRGRGGGDERGPGVLLF